MKGEIAMVTYVSILVRMEVLRVATLEDAARLRPMPGVEVIPVSAGSHYVARLAPGGCEYLVPIARDGR